MRPPVRGGAVPDLSRDAAKHRRRRDSLLRAPRRSVAHLRSPMRIQTVERRSWMRSSIESVLNCQRRDDPRGPQLVERFYQPVFRPEDFVAAVLTQSSKTGAGQALMKSNLH